MKPSTIPALLCLALSAASTAPAANQVLLQNVGTEASSRGEAITTDGLGNLFIAAAGQTQTLITKTDPARKVLATFGLNGGADAAATDAQGNLILVGGTAFGLGSQLVNPLFPSLASGSFVMKLDSKLHDIVFSTFVDGDAHAVAVDPAGNIYLTGRTAAADFPVTPGAFQITPPYVSPDGFQYNASYAYLMEISPNGDKLLYATYFGADEPATCLSCFGPYPAAATEGLALAVGPSGQVAIGGKTDAVDLPVTAGAFDSTCYCPTGDYNGFLAVFSPGAPLKLSWSTYSGGFAVNALAFGSDGGLVIGGLNYVDVNPVTPYTSWRPTSANGFVAKVTASGTALAWSISFGGSTNPLGSSYTAGVTALAVDSHGQVVFTGDSDLDQLPQISGSPILGPAYVARLSSDGQTVENLYSGPAYSTGAALTLTPAGTFVSLGSSGALWIETAASGPSLLGIGNAASGPATGAVAPDEIVSLYGIGIGPQSALLGQVQNGVYTSSLGGYQVLFNGVAAPLLYAGPTQINAVVPYEVNGQASASVQLVTPSGTVAGPALAVEPADPYLFQNPFQSGTVTMLAAVNQDGTVNSRLNPAKLGSIVSIFASGGAVYGTDGVVAGADSLPGPALPVSVILSGTGATLPILYAGQAPEEITGLMQVNFQLPASASSPGSVTVYFYVGGVSNSWGNIYVTQ